MKVSKIFIFIVLLALALATIALTWSPIVSDRNLGVVYQPSVQPTSTIASAPTSTVVVATSSAISTTVLAQPKPKQTSSAPTSTIVVPASTTPAAPASAPQAAPVSRGIVEKANVGLLCHYKVNDPNIASTYSQFEDANGDIVAEKGSGVIINSKGYILTAKHIVDLSWANWAYSDSITPDEQTLNRSLTLDYCEVAVPPGDATPTAAEIESLNPSIVAQHPFPYIATLFFEPSQGTLSDDDYKSLDFAVLKIVGPSPDCKTFNTCSMPSSFPYVPVLSTSRPQIGQQIINFGYPAEAINSSGGGFTDFYLHGAVGRMGEYSGMTFQWSASDVMSGRSGSPIYWNGYVVGIEYAIDADNSTIDYALGMPAISRTLWDAGLGNVLSTH